MDTKLQIRKMMRDLFLKNKKLRWLLLFSGIVVAICIAIIIHKNSIPSWVKWQEKEISINRDAGTTIILKLDKKKLTAYDSAGAELFRSDDKFKMQDVITSDVDGDGQEEIITVLWKKGIYGPHRPFWVEDDEDNYSQHIFIYRFDPNGKIVSMWGASETGILVRRIKTLDKNPQILLCEGKDGDTTLWRWDSFGLKKVDSEVTFIAFGDNLIHSEILQYAEYEQGGKFDFLYEPFKDEIASADIAALNSETVLVEDRNLVSGYPSFGSPVAVGEAVADAGFDIAVCGNNHILDKGIGALDYTIDFYESKDVLCPGVQKSTQVQKNPYEIISKNGIRFAVFSYTYGTNAGDVSGKYPNAVCYLPSDEMQEKELVSDIKEAGNEADFIVVFVHWGEEYSKEVTKEQREMAALFAEGGADLVIGSHPHVVQDVETIKQPDGRETLIYYSLGNFRANQGQNEDTKTGGEAKIIVTHSWEGVSVKSHELKEIRAFWK